MSGRACHHCGLPIISPVKGEGEESFCCYGCCLVSRILGGGREGGPRTWETLRLSVGALLAMEVMCLSFLLYTGTVESQAVPAFHWLMLGLSTPAVLLVGYPFVLGAAGEVVRRRMGMQTLIGLGSFTAFVVSAINTVRGAGHVYFDTATMLPVLVLFGKLIEATAKTRAGQLVRGLETLLPQRALRIEPAGPREVPVAELRAGDRLQVRPGERLAADGCILDGRTVIEEAAFTGEAMPRNCGPGDKVFAGTVNGPGGLIVHVEQVSEGVLLRRIIEMAEQARGVSSRAERIAERVAAVFVPVVVVLAVAAAVHWTLNAGWVQGGAAALAVLVVACPCALGIATPLATALAIGRAAREGVLVRGGDAMERLGAVRTLFFDKTGTLTTNQPAVRAVQPADGEATEEELLTWLAALESGSEHSLARAIVTEARARNLPIGQVAGLRAIPGQGVEGTVTLRGVTRRVVAGADSLLAPPTYGAAALGGDCTVINVSWDGRVRGRVLLQDAVRPDAPAVIARLRQASVVPVLLSGDRVEAAQAVAFRVGIDWTEAPRRPEEKIAAVRSAGGGAGMVGDGINDAPALAAADVGIALGGGADLARQAGNVVLISNRLDQIPWLIRLSRFTRRIIAQNLALSFGYNAVALAAAAAGLLHPLLAALAMVVSSLAVLSNSLRIQGFSTDADGR